VDAADRIQARKAELGRARRESIGSRDCESNAGLYVVETIEHFDGSLDLVVVDPHGELKLVRQRPPKPAPSGIRGWLLRFLLH
jgi:hypothetical protein